MASDIPSGFQIIGPANFPVYQEWMGKAIADPTVRRFLALDYIAVLESAPASDWDTFIMVSDRTMIKLRLNRSSMEISISFWTIGERKELASGRGLVALAWAIRRYRNFRYIRTCCATTNAEAMRLNRKIFGEPWGIEPQGCWDEAEGYVGLAYFSAPMDAFIASIDRRAMRHPLRLKVA